MSTIIQTLVQLKGESEPQPHFALVFDDAKNPSDFMVYRNALTSAAKTLAAECDGMCDSEIFWLVQLSEFISTALDMELYWKGGDNG